MVPQRFGLNNSAQGEFCGTPTGITRLIVEQRVRVLSEGEKLNREDLINYFCKKYLWRYICIYYNCFRKKLTI